MLKGLLSRIIEDRSAIMERNKGVAFLLAVRSIYELSDIWYFCANVPRHSSGSFVHCAFGADFASQAITAKPVPQDRLASIEFLKLSRNLETASESLGANSTERDPLSAWPLTTRGNEVAVMGCVRDLSLQDAEGNGAHSLAELKILGNYFHSHMLRRNGTDTAEALVVSARELDCLRWVAAGKSAWEASVILGISERTVRFHLNSVREKLNCTTTTQAVAKVVAQQLISV